jgi:hypothetical protein
MVWNRNSTPEQPPSICRLPTEVAPLKLLREVSPFYPKLRKQVVVGYPLQLNSKSLRSKWSPTFKEYLTQVWLDSWTA